MPRKARIISSTGIYHIILRSVNQHIIFEEDSDYQKFLYIMTDCKKKYDIDIYAYCLMDNHVHLIVNAKPDMMSSFFKSFGARFVRWYNIKYSRCGHLFQDRYHSRIIETTEYFLKTLIYIHDNPVKANICRYPSEYRWSSFNAYYGANNELVNVDYACSVAGSKDALHLFFSKEYESIDTEWVNDVLYGQRESITDEKALLIFKSITNLPSAQTTNELTKKERNDCIIRLKENGLSINQIARITDFSPSTIKRACKIS